jgi:hypothetical protein
MQQSLEAHVRENVHEHEVSFAPSQINQGLHWDELDGVFLCKGVSEVFGEAGAGKSQFVLFLLYRFLLKNQTKSALYLSTDNYFKANRFFDFCHSQLELGDRLFIQQIYDADSLLQYLNYFVSQLIQQEGIAFIVLDSIAGPLRVCDTREQKAFIAEIDKSIRRLIHTYGMVIIVTNQATASLGTSNLASREISSPEWPALLRNCSPALGLFWSNCVDNRLYIERRSEGPSPTRSLFLIRSSTHKPFSCTMEIHANTIKFTH